MMMLIDGKPYSRARMAENKSSWVVDQVASQAGDSTAVVPIPVSGMHLNIGISQRQSDGGRIVSPEWGAEYTKNGDLRRPQFICNSPGVTTLDLSSAHKKSRGLRIGGNYAGLGGKGGSFGGGNAAPGPQQLIIFGDIVYTVGGSYVTAITPSGTPAVVEAKAMGNGADSKSAVVRNEVLIVAGGAGSFSFQADEAFTSTNPTNWQITDVIAETFGKGKARGYRSIGNLVSNVGPAIDMGQLSNYSPGDRMGDSTHKVTEIAEFGGVMLGATEGNVHRFDFVNGFESVPILPELDEIPGPQNGRGMRVVGGSAFFPHHRGLFFANEGEGPRKEGLEARRWNESPVRKGEYGKPATDGDWVYYPYYIPSDGDSYILAFRKRERDEPGVHEFVIQSFMYLPDVECRCATFWRGSDTEDAKLFFGAGDSPNIAAATRNVEKVGWTYPDFEASAANPAELGQFFLANDDFGAPDVIDEVSHLVLPNLINVDANNFVKVAISTEDGAADSYVELEVAQGESEATKEGLTFFYPPAGTIIEGASMKIRIEIVQEAASATPSFVIIRGVPVLYLFRRTAMVDQVTMSLDIVDQTGMTEGRTVDEVRSDLEQLKPGAKILVMESPDADEAMEYWVKVVGVQTVQRNIAVKGGEGVVETIEEVAQLVFRKVEVAPSIS